MKKIVLLAMMCYGVMGFGQRYLVLCPVGTSPLPGTDTVDAQGNYYHTMCVDTTGQISFTSKVTGGGSGGSPGGPNASVQFNNLSAFGGNAFINISSANGFLGVRNDSGIPVAPLDINWSGLNHSTVTNLLSVIEGVTSTGASPPSIHMISPVITLTGTDAAFTDTTVADYYATLTDSRTPSGTSTTTHELTTVSRFSFAGGANLGCFSCAAYYGTADYSGASTAANQAVSVFFSDGGTLTGNGGVLTDWFSFVGGFPSIVSSPNVSHLTVFASSDPNNVTGLNASSNPGCAAGFAVGSGVCSLSGGRYAFFSDSTAQSMLLGSLAVAGSTSAAVTHTLEAWGSVLIGAQNGTQSDISLNSHNNGSVAVTLKMPLAGSGINLKWPGDSATFVGTTNNFPDTAETGPLSAQTLYNAGDTNARYFRVTVYTVCSAAVASSTVTVNVTYKDGVQSQTASGPSLSCAASGTFQTYSTSFQLTSGGNNVQFSTSATNSPQYRISAIIEEINPSTNST